MISAGKLRHLITLQSKSTTRDAMGGEVVSWPDQATVRASVEPLRGREYFLARQELSDVQIRFVIRYYAGITKAWRVLWEGNPYDIEEVIDVDGLHVEQQLMAKTQQNG